MITTKEITCKRCRGTGDDPDTGTFCEHCLGTGTLCERHGHPDCDTC